MNYFTQKIEASSGWINSYSGRSNSSAYYVVNEKGEFGFLKGEEKPYSPIGGKKALVEVFKMNCMIFKPYSGFSSDVYKKAAKRKIK